jgi:hypothetical protein
MELVQGMPLKAPENLMGVGPAVESGGREVVKNSVRGCFHGGMNFRFTTGGTGDLGNGMGQRWFTHASEFHEDATETTNNAS